MGRFVKLGKYAGFFRDSVLDISIAKGEVVELNVRQLNSPKIHNALNGGHLVFTEDPRVKAKEEEVKEATAEELADAFYSMVKSGEKEAKILRTFSLEDFKKIAAVADIEVEDTDTKKSIYAALVEDIEENENNEDE